MLVLPSAHYAFLITYTHTISSGSNLSKICWHDTSCTSFEINVNDLLFHIIWSIHLPIPSSVLLPCILYYPLVFYSLLWNLYWIVYTNKISHCCTTLTGRISWVRIAILSMHIEGSILGYPIMSLSVGLWHL